MAIVLGSDSEGVVPSELILLDTNGRPLERTYATTDDAGLSRLVDINHDGRSELLLAGFATLELLDPGVGVRKYSQAWDYRLDAEPRSVLAADIDNDLEQEILIGTDDGRLHALGKEVGDGNGRHRQWRLIWRRPHWTALAIQQHDIDFI